MLEVTLIAMGNKMPTWVNDATETFTKRLKEVFKLNLVELPLIKRSHAHELPRVLEKEAVKLQEAIPKGAHLIALDSRGKHYTSEALASHLDKLQLNTPHICFVIGGPEGLPQSLLSTSHEKLSLSNLTLPHPIARIMLLEALYRSWAISNHHPYHK